MAENIIGKDLRTHADVFTDLYANAPSRTDYNVGVNADLANRVSQGLGSVPGIGPALSAIADVAMPAGAFALSPAYDTLQGISRAGTQYSDKGPYAGIVDDTEVPAGPTLGQIGQAIANEKIGQTMFERMVGASAPLANRISNFNAPSIMGTAQAAEVNPMSIDRFTGQVGPNKSNMNALAPLDMARFAGVSQLGRNDIDVEQIEELSGLQSFRNQISGLKDFLPFGPKSLTGMAARGLGSMLSNINIAPRTYGYSQRTYDAMTPSQQEFVDDLYNPDGLLEGYNKISAFGRGPLGTLSNRLGTIQNTLARQKVKSKVLQQREKEISNAINESINRGEREALSDRNRSVDYGVTGGPTRTDIDVADGGAESGGRGKIVCTMMNDSYGFGNFRNKIWLKHSRDLPKEYEVGYHTIFLPLVKFAKGEGKLNKTVKKTLEHIARHRTYDLKQEMKGKTHLLGRAYRKVLEPICFITGKIKSALGRG
jgi:hypothetical protein